MTERLEIGKPCVHIRMDHNRALYDEIKRLDGTVPVEKEIYIPRDFVSCPGCGIKWVVLEEIIHPKTVKLCTATGIQWDGEGGFPIEDFRPCRDTSRTVEALKSMPVDKGATTWPFPDPDKKILEKA